MDDETYAPPMEMLDGSEARQHIARESGSSSSARMLCVVFVCAFFVAISIAPLFMARSANAAAWPVSTSALSASLGFKQTYTAGDRSYAHSAIDIPASAGAQIASPLAGTVCFTGAIPSGDSRIGGPSSEKTMLAVSIQIENGRTITLMPFSTIDVHEGQTVSEGQRIGALASSGDISTSGPHLHMGYKQGSAYLDPMLLFGVPVQDNALEEEPVSDTVMASSGPVGQEMAPASPGVVAVPQSFGAIETGAFQWRPKVEAEHGSSIVQVFEPLAIACYGQAADLLQALTDLSVDLGVPLFLVIACVLSIAVAVIVLAIFLFIRFVLPWLRRLGAVRKSTLVHVRGG